MNREEQLKLCKICKNQVKDWNKGIICGVTGTYADFEDTCAFFKEDAEQKEIVETTAVKNEIIHNSASMGKRFANHLLDTLFFYMIVFMLGLFVGIVIVFAGSDSPGIFDEENVFIQYLLGFVLGVIYYSLFETLTGRTPAKYITKTKVINQEGEKPDFYTIFIRSLCRFIPFDALSFLLSEDSGWHDRLSKTRVVNC